MNFGLILKSEFDRQDYLFSRLYKTLNLSPEKKEAHQQEIVRLAKEQIKLFGGNTFSQQDQKRAIDRVIKLVNLGLEYASRRDVDVSPTGEMLNINMAKAILLNKPLSQMYHLGNEVFEMDRKSATELLLKSEIQIENLYFRLISEEEFACLKALSDLNLFKGTFEQLAGTAKTMRNISNKLVLVPFLPINESGLMIFRHLGGSRKGAYPTSYGLIDCLLLSLLIACMFRDEENLFNCADTRKATEFFSSLAKEAQSREEKEYAARSFSSINRMVAEDRKSRMASPAAQRSFLRDILAVEMKEVAEFADLLFFEPEKFGKQADKVRKFFIGYFDLAQETLIIKKKPAYFGNFVQNALTRIEKKIEREVSEFYKQMDDYDISSEQIAKFWHQRICSHRTDRKEAMEGIVLEARYDINPKQLSQASIPYLVAGAKYFLHWPEEKKKEFIDNLNPNRFINEERGDASHLLQFLDYISLGPMDIVPVAHSNQQMDIYKDNSQWIAKVMDKINWSRVFPSVIAELWQGGTDEVRDALWKHREEFKTSTPSLKKYYVFEHNDMRLLKYILDKMIKEEKIKQYALDDMLLILRDFPKAKGIVELIENWKNRQKK